MKILEKLAAKAADNSGAPGVTLAFLGDSVTQGCADQLTHGTVGTADDSSHLSTPSLRISVDIIVVDNRHQGVVVQV